MTREQHKKMWNEAYSLGFEHGKSEGRYEKFSEWDKYYNEKVTPEEKEYNSKKICKYCDKKTEENVDYCSDHSPYLKPHSSKKTEKIGKIKI